MIDIGTYLKNLRLNANMSQHDVQKATNITNSILSRIEHGQLPTPDILKQLSQLYHVDLISLYKLCGFLNNNDLLNYQHVFQNVDKLNPEEKACIQTTINLFTAKRGDKKNDI
ncbi:helix-turn-helix transcriptional regulator [Clostridium sp. AN503]|uniref:helix-turn-helix domain-containing protein n=1 Tax=Clostridium sp. AN503 TaxID=3160598 RepID=UPI003459F218